MSALPIKNKLIRGFLGSGALKAANVLLTFCVGVLLARELGPEEFGFYTFLMSLVVLIGLPAKAGLPKLTVREVARYDIGKKWGELKGLLSASTLFILGFSLISIAVSFVFVNLIWGKDSGNKLYLFSLATLLIPLVGFNSTRASFLKGLRHVVLGQIPEEFIKPFVTISLLIAFLLLGKDVSVTEAIYINIFATLCAFSIGAYFLYKKIPSKIKSVSASYEMANWANALLPFTLLSAVVVANGQVTIVVLGLVADDEAVGLYRVALQGATLISFFLTSMNIVISPYITRMYYSNEKEILQSLVTKTTHIATCLCVPVVLVFLFLGDSLIAFVFGKDYSGAFIALVIMSIGQLLNVIAGPTGLVLNMTGNEKKSVTGAAIGLLVNLGMSLALIPFWGLLGAAIASAISLIVVNLFQLRSVRKYSGIHTHFFRRS